MPKYPLHAILTNTAIKKKTYTIVHQSDFEGFLKCFVVNVCERLCQSCTLAAVANIAGCSWLTKSLQQSDDNMSLNTLHSSTYKIVLHK